MLVPFDQQYHIRHGRLTHAGMGVFARYQARLRPKGPSFWVLPSPYLIHTFEIWRRTTELGVVTHMWRGVLGEVSHAIAYCRNVSRGLSVTAEFLALRTLACNSIVGSQRLQPFVVSASQVGYIVIIIYLLNATAPYSYGHILLQLLLLLSHQI